ITNLIYVLIKSKKTDEAFQYCNQALTSDPSNSRVLYAKSIIYEQRNEIYDALKFISKAILIDPKIDFLHKRSKYYLRLRQFENAVADNDLILSNDSSNIESYFNRAMAYEGLKDVRTAVSDYKKVVVLAAGAKKSGDLAGEAKKRIFEL